ncbi:hypothetical protein NMY22_g2828 [Coprinellus aureogranulatus]|nr:hypothetical protein NMY22_g2828 [Coprinellus aureogranulatus]
MIMRQMSWMDVICALAMPAPIAQCDLAKLRFTAYSMSQIDQASSLPRFISGDLVVDSIDTHSIDHPHRVTSLHLSPDGMFLAIGDVSGKVTLRNMSKDGTRIAFLRGAKDVRITAIVWSPLRNPWSLFVASANGYVNCISFSMNDLTTDFTPHITGVKVPGLVSCLAINKDGSQLAGAYDYFTKVWDLPFPDGDLGRNHGRLINTAFPQPQWRFIPVRDHPRAIGLQYLDINTLVVGFFRKIQAYDTTERHQPMWSISAPENTNIGSFCISPDGKLIAATNLHSGVDWYSLTMKSWMSTTEIPDIYEQKSYILPVQFLTEQTFASGHNVGQITTGSNGLVATKALGPRRGSPSQYLTVAQLQEEIRIVYACSSNVLVTRFKLSGLRTVPISASQLNTPEIARARVSPPPQLSAADFGIRPFQTLQVTAPSALRVAVPTPSPSIFQTPADLPFEASKLSMPPLSKVELPKPLSTSVRTPSNNAHPPQTTSFALESAPASAKVQVKHDFALSSSTVKGDAVDRRAFEAKGSGVKGKQVAFVKEVRVDVGHAHEIDSQAGSDASPIFDRRYIPSSPSDSTSMTAGVPDSPSPPQRVDIRRSSSLVRKRSNDRRHHDLEERNPNRSHERDDSDELEHAEIEGKSDGRASSLGWVIYSRLEDHVLHSPKVSFVFFVTLAVLLFALFSQKEKQGADSLKHFPQADIGFARPESLFDGGVEEYDDDDEHYGEDLDDSNLEGGRDTVVVTQTNVLTVTRTVTSTAMSTVTVTMTQKPRRTSGVQKPRRRQP